MRDAEPKDVRRMERTIERTLTLSRLRLVASVQRKSEAGAYDERLAARLWIPYVAGVVRDRGSAMGLIFSAAQVRAIARRVADRALEHVLLGDYLVYTRPLAMARPARRRR